MKNGIWLVGEANPHGADPKFALYPIPANGAGGRLCRLLGMTEREYLRAFERRNLLATPPPKWSSRWARVAAIRVEHEFRESGGLALVLLGARVSAAFGLDFQHGWLCPGLATAAGSRVLVAPHPSGRCRIWNDASVAERFRAHVGGLLALAELRSA